MKNIIWQKPDGGFAVTRLYDITVDSAEHAAQIKAAGSIPAEWVIHAIDAATPPKTPAEREAEQSAAAKLALEKIDRDSIRSIREYIAAKPDAPQSLKNLEATAISERARVRTQ